ncbi:MAG: Homoserine dehydrogenase [Thermoleophilia bacterium]|nr:Homoserine dehydrogenase [Thermoleophilia bacterium]
MDSAAPTAPAPASDTEAARGDAPTRPVRVALLGLGTVGSALNTLLVEHREHVRLATQRDIEVCAVLVRDASKARSGIDPERTLVTDSLEELLATDPDVVCEAMGGIEPTRTHLLALLDRGIPVVTANKQLVARHGTELFARAAAAGAQLRFEASVCGAVPIVRMLRESLAATRIERLLGILNGTTNYMLSAMTAHGQDYADALSEAQRLGYAEPDPTEDVEGIDAGAKLAILAGIAFGTTVDVADVRTTGISGVTAEDVSHADVLGCRIKLVARAERLPASSGGTHLALDVTPMLVPESHPLASIAGATNAVLVDGAPFGRLVVQGAGAGGPETASALAGDLVSVLGSEPSFLTRDPHVSPLRAAPRDAREESHYVRMRVADQPGVLAAVAGALAGTGVSIERVLQQRAGEGHATLVLTTHPCAPGDLERALANVECDDRTVLPILEATDR